MELDFVEVKESKYRKNAALQIKQEVENVLKHAKLSGDQESEPKQEDTARLSSDVRLWMWKLVRSEMRKRS